MKLFGILGYPLELTLSPFLMNSFFKYADIDAVYRSFPIEPEGLQRTVEEMQESGFVGANVTIPHKEHILSMVNLLSDDSRRIGAVNTLLWKDGYLGGYNTDTYGFIKSLEETEFSLKHSDVLVFGSGGAARAVVYAVLREQCKRVYISARDLRKAGSMRDAIATNFLGQQICLLPWDSQEIGKVMHSVSIVVNATPLGMGEQKDKISPLPLECLSSAHLVYDLIYNPAETHFLTLAKQKGAKTINGLPMLLYQAAKSIEIWLGENVEKQTIPYWNNLILQKNMVAKV